jgi:UDP-galactopyranose mutase
MNRSVKKKHEKMYSFPVNLSQMSQLSKKSEVSFDKRDSRPAQSISGWQETYAIDE